MIYDEIVNVMREKKSFAIVSHIMPDGDSIGSMLGLYIGLLALNKDVNVYTSDRLPEVYSFLPHFDSVEVWDESRNKHFDVLVVLDCGSLDRTGDCSGIAGNSDFVMNIDHHGTNSMFGSLNHVNTDASSVGEIIYDIMKHGNIDITRDMAVCLYTAVLTDTGGFRYSNTTPKTLETAASLVGTGIDFGKIYELVYRSLRYNDVVMLGRALSTIELYEGGKIAYMQLLRSDMGSFELNGINTSDFIDYARDINGVEAAVFIKESHEGEYKLSFRSKRHADVKSVCEKFGGGGHVRAAGCTIKGNLAEIKRDVLMELQKSVKDDSTWME